MNEWRERFEDEWEQLVVKVKTHKLYQEGEQRYHALTERDQMVVNIMAVVLAIFLLWQVIIGPALGYLMDAKSGYAKQLENHEWMVTNASVAKERLNAGGEDREGSLLSIASATAKNYELSFSRFEPIGDDRVRLWMEQIKFNNLVSWLGELETNNGISAVDISLDSASPGYVSVRLTLQG